MPSLEHEAPLLVLREAPPLVPALLRDALGVPPPPFAGIEVADTDFTQVLPTEFRADLVVKLVAPGPEAAPVMGIVLELQRARDEDKRRSWPLYVSALHARLRCRTCLVVLATDAVTARWASRPIETMQPGSPFTPLVLGPDRVPPLSLEHARSDPWMTVLSSLVHGREVDGQTVALATLAALAALHGDQAEVCYNLVYATLDEERRRALEDTVRLSDSQIVSPFMRERIDRARREGREEGRVEVMRQVLLDLAGMKAALSDELRGRVLACADVDALRALTTDVAAAADDRAVLALLQRLAPMARPVGA